MTIKVRTWREKARHPKERGEGDLLLRGWG